jgi:hypothetical protein
MKRTIVFFLFIIPLTFLGSFSCTEPNPDYDPDFVPPCKEGTVICSDDLLTTLACQDDGNGSRSYMIDKTCWEGTLCNSGFCGSGDSGPCDIQEDCTDTLICTAVPISRSELGNFCIPAPLLEGIESEKACSLSSQCKSGWCFKKTCYTPCTSADDCHLGGECALLSVTIDGIQGTLNGCAIP